MIERHLLENVEYLLSVTPSVALLGPRQVGKTTLAHTIAEKANAIYLDMEDPLDIQKVQDVVGFHAENRGHLIILDEVQRVPEIFAPVRTIIDKERRKGNKNGLFLFLGSASIELLQQSGESLAGRIAYSELFPLNILEFQESLNQPDTTLWLRGGFPESLLATNELNSYTWRKNFIRTYLERDIPQLGPRIPASTLQRFWTMLAHHQGSVMNAAHLARSLDVSGTTIARYLDLMCDLLLVRRLQPWTFNIGKRLIRSPKIYVRDSGLVHTLLNIKEMNELLGHPVVGGSWEGFVIENIISALRDTIPCYYYGTPGGAEIDLILEFSPSDRWAIEIKRSTAPSISKGFHLACDEIKASQKFVVYNGTQRFPMTNGITAISLRGIVEEVQSRN
ncbi:MAG: ATP-binding protein [Sphingobacteriia bacterium]|nr:ATP-binding protein [Sphingobacteriia bacterium]